MASKQKLLKTLLWKNVDYCEYFRKNEAKTVIQPNIGSILHMIPKEEDKKLCEKEMVVVKIFRKIRGGNKGIIDRACLSKIISKEENIIWYDENALTVDFMLNNHGNWFRQSQLKKWELFWNEQLNSTNKEDSNSIYIDVKDNRDSWNSSVDTFSTSPNEFGSVININIDKNNNIPEKSSESITSLRIDLNKL